jgi:hypothetical protein
MVEIIYDLINSENIDEEEIRDACYHLFFGFPGSYTFVSSLLEEAGIKNKPGEGDEFGALSWGVKIPKTDDWIYFG